MNKNYNYFGVLESGLSKASATTREFFNKTKTFSFLIDNDKVIFYGKGGQLICSIVDLYENGRYVKITTANSIINIWRAKEPFEVQKGEQIMKGYHKGIEYEIRQSYTCPCAYILTQDEKAHGLNVHGGITWEPDNEGNLAFDGKPCFGWDYGHFGDYDLVLKKGKKYSTFDIMCEVKMAINELLS